MSKLTLRKRESEEVYTQKAKGKVVDLWQRPAVFENDRYKIIENEYPYDLAHEKNLILLTNDSAEKAFEYAKEYTEMNDGEFDQITWNTPHSQTQGHIVHIHILKFRRI